MHKHVLTAAIFATLSMTGVALAQNAPTRTTRSTTTTTTVSAHPRMHHVTGALSESEIKSDIAGAGYKTVKGLKFDNGVWEAEARGGNDEWTHIKIGPASGKVYEEDAPSRLNKDEIKAKLTAEGYQNIDDVSFDDGLWKADAKTPRGKDVDLLVDPDDGSVVASMHD